MFRLPRLIQLQRHAVGIASGVSALGVYYYIKPASLHATLEAQNILESEPLSQLWAPPSRGEMLARLGSPEALADVKNKHVAAEQEFDILICGGGATGVGCALDAATRGLKVALVERDDFASGTSSRSTKLVHGGVRYLEKAFKELDIEQYKLVVEALHERANFLKIAPHLSYELPTMIPIYKYWQVPYFYAGCKVYELLAGKEGLSPSYFLGKRKAKEAFPMLKDDHLVGAIVYYDGAHNDSRMNVAIALTAASKGAVMANHVELVQLIKKNRTTFFGRSGFGAEEICGAVVKDTLTGAQWSVKCKGVINATGPFCDGLRKLDTGIKTQEIVAPSAGVHIVLPSYFGPRNMGLLDPNTSDGRVIFFLPWQGNIIAGTTDSPADVESNPKPSETDINWILSEIERYLDPSIKVRRGDVLAAWSGIRPLVRDPAAKNTESLVRNHMINVSESGLLTIAGGKWTTYREMAEETIDIAIEKFDLKGAGPCVTTQTLLIGAHGWNRNMFIKLIQSYGLETDVAQHLAESYGDRAWSVAGMASMTGERWPIHGKRLSQQYPFIEAEIKYAVRREYACTAVDVIARRMRLAMLNAQAAKDALPRVIEIMADELSWSKNRQRKEYADAIEFLKYMGLDYLSNNPDISADDQTFYTRNHFVPEELERYQTEFHKLDYKGDGRIRAKDLSKILGALGEKSAFVDDVLKRLDVGTKGSLEFGEFLEVLSDIKEVKQKSKFVIDGTAHREEISVSRSGGGV